jgi:hypothetical protein
MSWITCIQTQELNWCSVSVWIYKKIRKCTSYVLCVLCTSEGASEQNEPFLNVWKPFMTSDSVINANKTPKKTFITWRYLVDFGKKNDIYV